VSGDGSGRELARIRGRVMLSQQAVKINRNRAEGPGVYAWAGVRHRPGEAGRATAARVARTEQMPKGHRTCRESPRAMRQRLERLGHPNERLPETLPRPLRRAPSGYRLFPQRSQRETAHVWAVSAGPRP